MQAMVTVSAVPQLNPFQTWKKVVDLEEEKS